MAVHDGRPYVAAAVQSILGQTLRDFEFILIDDASRDGTASLVRDVEDRRIRLIRNAERLGLTRSLNLGLEQAQGEYVARMDHDDLSLPTRFARQTAFLDAHPEVDVCGTWAKTMGLEHEQTWRYPLADGAIRSEMFFNSVLVHSSVMMRREVLVAHHLHYDPKVERAQDYELWVRAADQLRFANLGQVLLRYRIHPGQVGQRKNLEQQRVADAVRRRQIVALGLKPTPQQLAIHHAISRWEFQPDLVYLRAVEDWLQVLRQANQQKDRYPEPAFSQTLGRRWWAACKAAQPLGSSAWGEYRHSPLSKQGKPGLFSRLRFFIKAWQAGRRRQP